MSGRRRDYEVVPIQQIDVYNAVRRSLSDLIERGGYESGDRLPSERELGEALSVSRTAIREAMKVLESVGRVEIRQGAGTFVRSPHSNVVARFLLAEVGAMDRVFDQSFLVQLIDARAAVETKIAELAAEKADLSAISNIGDVLRRIEDEHLPDPEIGSLNISFEAALGTTSGSPLLVAIQRAIHQLWVDAWGTLKIAPSDKRALHREHLDIFSAVRDKDVDRAGSLMRQHVDRLLVFSQATTAEAAEPEPPATGEQRHPARSAPGRLDA